MFFRSRSKSKPKLITAVDEGYGHNVRNVAQCRNKLLIGTGKSNFIDYFGLITVLNKRA